MLSGGLAALGEGKADTADASDDRSEIIIESVSRYARDPNQPDISPLHLTTSTLTVKDGITGMNGWKVRREDGWKFGTAK